MAQKEEMVKVRAADGTETRMRRADAEVAGLTVVEEEAPAVAEEPADASGEAERESGGEPE